MMGDRLSAPYGYSNSYISRYPPSNAVQLYGPGQSGPPAPMPPPSRPLNYSYAHAPPQPAYVPFYPDGTSHPQLPMHELQRRHPRTVPSTPQDNWNYADYRPPHARRPPNLPYSAPLPPQIQVQVPESTGNYTRPLSPPIQLQAPRFRAAPPHALTPHGPPPMKKIDRLAAEVSSTRKEAGEYEAEIGNVIKASREVQLRRLEELERMLGVVSNTGAEGEEDTATGKETLMSKFDLFEAGVERISKALEEFEKVEGSLGGASRRVAESGKPHERSGVVKSQPRHNLDPDHHRRLSPWELRPKYHQKSWTPYSTNLRQTPLLYGTASWWLRDGFLAAAPISSDIHVEGHSSLHRFMKRLRVFGPGAHSLTLKLASYESRYYKPADLSSFTSLTRLCLHGIEFRTFHGLAQLMALLPSLEKIALVDVRWRETGERPATGECFPCLRQFYISCLHPESVLDWLGCHELPDLHHVGITLCPTSSGARILAFLAKISLDHLEIGPDNAQGFSSLVHSISVKHRLAVHSTMRRDDNTRYEFLRRPLPPHTANLFTTHLIRPTHTSVFWDLQLCPSWTEDYDWDGLDHIFTSSQFATTQRFVLLCFSPLQEQTVMNKLPMSSRRGDTVMFTRLFCREPIASRPCTCLGPYPMTVEHNKHGATLEWVSLFDSPSFSSTTTKTDDLFLTSSLQVRGDRDSYVPSWATILQNLRFALDVPTDRPRRLHGVRWDIAKISVYLLAAQARKLDSNEQCI
ncbi:hypothetical protein FB45DRAFT_997619 [Roridomyces roridus]|uniref:Uncharacterized protein n=1 Tax=Roridomyces roridus TaxID=1738132 RepID=A0AAD7CK44_9AGAR|nr:hypothetical protein FB45DRAFT_997619 [Roridomyces roridus]